VPSLRNLRTGAIVAADVARADSLWRHLSGLIPYGTVASDQGMWFDNCWAIHTIGMRQTIDVLFLAKDHGVLKIHYAVPPYRPAVVCAGAKVVVELGASAERRDVRVGDRLTLE
jgi:uncharacterized membrane protein (UPF0127 family)